MSESDMGIYLSVFALSLSIYHISELIIGGMAPNIINPYI